ncbi:MAG: hypothetical protein ABH869_02130 [Candidatus Omnitrophota bacterium]
MKKNNIYILIITLILISCTVSVFASSLDVPGLSPGEWEEYKSAHFIVYYQSDIPRPYISSFANKCENYYRAITHRLGFNRFDFWLWDDRARIFMYNTKEEYLSITGRAQWSGASVHVKDKLINTFYFDEDFFDYILPHELGHIILREFIGTNTAVPLWLDEGVACANEKSSSLRYLLIAKKNIEKGLYVPLTQIGTVSPGTIKAPNVFYPTAASVIIFMLEEYGKRRFVDFCKELRDGKNFEEAVKKVYRIGTIADLEKKFLSFMEEKSYQEIIDADNFDARW